MNLDRWNMLARVMRAPEDGTGAAATAPATTNADAAASGSAAASSAAPAAAPAPSTEAAPAKAESPASPLASADAGKRDGAPAADAKPATETPAKAGEAPPTGGTEGTDAKPEGAKPDGKEAAKPDAAADKSKELKPGETAEAKPEGADAAADKKPESAEAPPAPPPAYDAYKLPENLKLDDKKLSEFNTLLGEAEVTGGAKHEAMQALGQKMMDLYASEVQRIGQDVMKHQVDVWNRHLEGELNVLKSDPDLGGNRIDTTLGNAKYVLEQFGGSKDEQDRFMATLDRAGVSSNRDFVAMLNRMFERYREPAPVSPNLPSFKAKTPGQRSWYDTVDLGGAKG